MFGQSGPNVNSLTFSPASINTTGVSASVTVNFNITGTGVFYFATAFQDPSGNFIGHQVDKLFTPSNSVTDSVTITFPPFSPPGNYRIAYVFALDANGFEFLSTPDAVSAAFPTLGTLTVNSSVDTTPPNLTSLTFNGSINTTSASDVVNVSFSATDAGDNGGPASGVASVSVTFQSPSGGNTITGVGTVTPAASASGTIAITFPKLSEAGTWTLIDVIVSDQANNTQVLATADLTAKGIATTLTVTSATDTTAPTLTAFSISPGTISSNGGAVSVGFAVTDDISGANNIGVTLVSPSASQQLSGSASFAPALTKSGSIVINFPTGTEQGTWSVAFVILSDAQGNTRLYNATQLAGLGFSSTLNVIPPGADTTPPAIFVNVSPMPNGAGWNNTLPVNVTWTVTDPESGIASSTGCDPVSFNAPTTGTTLTCSATNGAGLSSSSSVVVRIDLAPPVVTNQLATPNPVIVNTDVTITATVTDTGGSNVKSADFSVDGGPFDDLAPVASESFGTSSVDVTLTLPASATPLLQTTGVHSICFRGTDFADNISASQCVLFAVYDPTGGFATGGGNINSPAGADSANPSGSGQASFAFNAKYLPNNPNVPSGDFQFTYPAGNISFKGTSYDFLVVTNGNRAQMQGTGTLNGTTVCKFSIDSYNASFLPGNVDALGVTIFNCGSTTGNRYNLPTAPIAHGSIKIHQ
jgi:hypothetical protein